MKIFAIGDTHLSGNPPFKPMHIFGDHWIDHWQKIKTDWQKNIAPEDAVLLTGDISWAMKWEAALEDLEEIANLPGEKYIIRGNHDYWWQTISKMERLAPPSLHFIQNNYYELLPLNIALCGTRGWLVPTDPTFTEDDQAIYAREVNRLHLSLEAAKNAGYQKIIVLLHYPPLLKETDQNGFLDLLDEYQVAHCVYGHLHGQGTALAFNEQRRATSFRLVSCDALDFSLIQI